MPAERFEGTFALNESLPTPTTLLRNEGEVYQLTTYATWKSPDPRALAMNKITVTKLRLEEQLKSRVRVIVKRKNSRASVFFRPIFSMSRSETMMPGNSASVVQSKWL